MSRHDRLQKEVADMAARLTSDGRAHFLGAITQLAKHDATMGVLDALHTALQTTAASVGGDYLRSPAEQAALDASMHARFPATYPKTSLP